MTAKSIGPSFPYELAAAGCASALSWTPDGEITFGPSLTPAQIAAIQAVYAAHDPASPLPAPVLAAAALKAGLAVTSTATPALDGTYACDAVAQAHVGAEITSILLNGTFADGGATVPWPDATGAVHTFDVAGFKAFAAAIGAYVAALFKVINGTSATLPPATATIP